MKDKQSRGLKLPVTRFWNQAGLIFCRKGEVELQANELSCVFKRGDILLVTPLVQVYKFMPSDDYEELAFLDVPKTFYLMSYIISESKLALNVRDWPVWHMSEEQCEFLIKQHALIEEKYRELENSREEEIGLINYQIELLKVFTVSEIIRKRIPPMSENDKVGEKNITIFYNFIMALYENYREHRNVAWYAEKVQLSPVYFTSIVKKATGVTPSHWIATVTISFAKIMLEKTDLTIKQIALQLNFPEQFTFRKYFKLHTGFSPREYRKNYLKGHID